MMKNIIFTGVLVLASAMTGEAMAISCDPVNRVSTVANLNTLLSGNTICVPVAGPPWDAQEEHIPGGVLMDYKKGPGDPVDQERALGTWLAASLSLIGGTTVTYTYTAFMPPFSATYRVYSTTPGQNIPPFSAGWIYEFCAAPFTTPSATGKLKTGTGAGCL